MDKYELLRNKKFDYIIKLNNTNSIRPISCKEILNKILKKLRLDFNLSAKEKEIHFTIDDIITQKYKVINVVSAAKDSFPIYISLKELPLKGKAKRLGLKSVFVEDNKLILTTIGKDDDVLIEKEIKNNSKDDVISYINPENYAVNDVTQKNITLSNDKIQVDLNNPTYSKTEKATTVKQDYLGRKDVIEKKFFNDTFNDNIHIQLAYNIMDINKIFNIYSNEVVFTMENLAHKDDAKDFIGNIIYQKEINENDKFNDYFDSIFNSLRYFSQAFPNKTFDKIKIDGIKDYNRVEIKKNTKIILRILSMFRQFSMHGDANLFNLKINDQNSELFEYFSARYDDVYNNLINRFVNTSKINIAIIFDALKLPKNDNRLKKEILNDYFDFSITKSFVNMGFNFKRLKEALISKLNLEISDEKKQATYNVINYLIYRHLKQDSSIVDKYVKCLVASEGDLDKIAIYDAFADEIKLPLKNIITQELVDNQKRNREYKYFNIDDRWLKDSFNNIDPICKAIYFLTIFLDTKEINMLVTTIINKLKNINGLVKVLNNQAGLIADYSLFDKGNAKKIADQLSVVLSIARMQKNINKKFKSDNANSANKPSSDMIYDAYCLFGYKESKETFEKELKADTSKPSKGIAKFQNKITSAIVNSNKFRFIIKYANPRNCYSIMKNTRVVSFVLKEIPQSQIDKYIIKKEKYNSLNYDAKINALAKELADVSIYEMRKAYNIRDKVEANNLELPKLFMTIIYQVIKNMVRINTYYNIAFSCLERDKKLFNVPDNYCDYSDLMLLDAFVYGTNEFDVSNNGKCEHIRIDVPFNKYNRKVDDEIITVNGPKLGSKKYSWLKDDIDVFKEIFYKNNKPTEIESCNAIYRTCYRNTIAHLNAISNMTSYLDLFVGRNNKMNSYFELYQYIIQMNFIHKYKEHYKNEFINDQCEVLQKYKTYSKDLLHILNLPFAYNMARYKNLTIEDIFYDRFLYDIKISK